MGLFDLFSGGNSSSRTETNNQDNRVGSESGSATRIEGAQFAEGAQLTIGSDAVAREALSLLNQGSETALGIVAENSEEALAQTGGLVQQLFRDALSFAGDRAASSEANVGASQQFARDVTAQAQTTGDDRILGLVKLALFGGVAVAALNSGIAKEFFK